MQINFSELLLQSWNFMRNQSKFCAIALVSLLLLQFINVAFLPAAMDLTNPNNTALSSAVLFRVVPAILTLLLNLLIILNIKSINEGVSQPFFQNAGRALQRFIPAMLLTFMMAFPLSIGASAVLLGGDTAFIGMALMVSGLYLYIRFSLAVYANLLESPQQRVGESLKFVWALGRGRMMPLVVYCLLSQLLPTFISTSVLGVLGTNAIGLVLSTIISVLLSLFMTIFGFRFYQAFRQDFRG